MYVCRTKLAQNLMEAEVKMERIKSPLLQNLFACILQNKIYL